MLPFFVCGDYTCAQYFWFYELTFHLSVSASIADFRNFFFFWGNFLINKFPFSSQNNWYPPVCLVVFYAVCFMACFGWGRDLYWFVYRHDKYWPYRQPIQYNIENFDLCYKESHIWTKTHWPAQYFFITNGTDPKAPTPTMVFFSLVLMYPP